MLLESLLLALNALRVNKLRSALTMLGIIIGVGAVIAMIALGNGAQQAVRDRIAKLGTTILQIDATRVAQGGVQLAVFKKITMADVDAINEHAQHVMAVEPQQDKPMQIVWRNKNTNMSVFGVTPNFLDVRKFDIDQGRMFTEAENRGRQRVAVLGAGAITALDITDPLALLGQQVRIQGRMFTVIGTLKAKGAGNGFGNPDDQVLVPFETGRFRLFGTDKLDDIFAIASSEDDVPAAMSEIATALRKSHRILPGAPDDFRIRNQADFLTTLGETTQVFTLLLAGIAAVSLVVGGIGIMNIMLVSVTERTKEIGVRKALGATKRNILMQFLMEAVTLCLLGGVIGIGAGMGTSAIMRSGFGWSTVIAPSSILLSFAFAGAVGVAFGVWPARRAAQLDPIEALRYE